MGVQWWVTALSRPTHPTGCRRGRARLALRGICGEHHVAHHRLLYDAELAVDLSRQRAVCGNRCAERRERQHQTREIRADLRAERRAAAAETLAAAPRLPADGLEALARGA